MNGPGIGVEDSPEDGPIALPSDYHPQQYVSFNKKENIRNALALSKLVFSHRSPSPPPLDANKYSEGGGRVGKDRAGPGNASLRASFLGAPASYSLVIVSFAGRLLYSPIYWLLRNTCAFHILSAASARFSPQRTQNSFPGCMFFALK